MTATVVDGGSWRGNYLHHFLLDLINAIVNACIIYNNMVSPLCAHESQYVEYAEEDYTDCNMKKMNNHYTSIIYLTSQKKCF